MAIIASNGFASSDSGADSFIQDGVTATGAVHWVDSASGSDSNSGNEAAPLATLAQAITNATANNGDIIVIKSGHAQTLSTVTTINKAGIRVFGIGNGTDAPAFTVAAAIDGINITADDVELNNLYFPVGTSTGNNSRINVDADRARIKNCRFNCGALDQNTITITSNGSNCSIDSSTFTVTADGPDAGIIVEAAVTGLWLSDCSFDGGSFNWDDAGLYSNSAHLNFRYEGVTLTNYAGIKHNNASAKGQMGALALSDGSQVQA